MIFTLPLSSLPFEQDPLQVIYIEGQYDVAVNNFIRANYKQIKENFARRKYHFIYLPFYFLQVRNYQAPYAADVLAPDSDINSLILNHLVYPLQRKDIGPSLLFFKRHTQFFDHEKGGQFQFKGLQIPYKDEHQLELFFRNAPLEIYRFIPPMQVLKTTETGTLPYYGTKSDLENEQDFPMLTYEEKEKKAENRLLDSLFLFFHLDHAHQDSNTVPTIDEKLIDEEVLVLLAEIEDRMNRLEMKGIGRAIVQNYFSEKKKLSRLVITQDYRLFLPDYNNLEIEMTPIVKTVYLLYLRYPNGIPFKNLPDYRGELESIYQKLKKGKLTEKAKQSVTNVTNTVMDNSINEKCARIREAFTQHFSSDLAKFYTIEGERGEAKKIALPRELIIYEPTSYPSCEGGR